MIAVGLLFVVIAIGLFWKDAANSFYFVSGVVMISSGTIMNKIDETTQLFKSNLGTCTIETTIAGADCTISTECGKLILLHPTEDPFLYVYCPYCGKEFDRPLGSNKLKLIEG